MLRGISLRSALRSVAVGAVLAVAVVGCQPGVREDRTITIGPDGRASFQHGRNGVFVTDPVTGKPRRIYETRNEDLAVGPPTWDPSGKRMVFTVARSADGKRYEPMGDGPADGRSFAAMPVRYTCWLYDPSAPNAAPEKLFEAACGHVGYVGAGLAVSWHPDGQRLDYVDQPAPKQHRVHAFDLTTRKAEAVPLPIAENVAIGSAPGQPHRYAVLGGAGEQSGLWIYKPANGTWWLVANSAPEKTHLEELRRRLPKWSRDGTKFAYVAGSTLRVGSVETREVEDWFHSPEQPSQVGLRFLQPLTAFHWHPDGNHVGVVDRSRLLLVGPGGSERQMTDQSVVSFAGWDVSGRRMAYVTTEPLPYVKGEQWSTLFVPNPEARCAVQVADADGTRLRKVLVSGVRATFPHWSPTDHRLSVWLTVEPPYHLAAGRFGMPPGDPAALIDPDTGKLEWLPVSGTEHAQIAHVELRAGRDEEALRQFVEAAASLQPNEKPDWMFFLAIALQKTGRTVDAEDVLRLFSIGITQERIRALESVTGAAAVVRAPGRDQETINPRHRFVAEAFISLDMAEEAIDFFRREMSEAQSDSDRLSATVVLCQLLLLTDQREEYAKCVVDELLPLASRVLPGTGPDQNAVAGPVAMTLLPLVFSEFTAPLPEELIRRVSEKASTWPKGVDDVDFACQLVLRACGKRLQDKELTERAEVRAKAHPARVRWGLTEGREVDNEFLTRMKLSFMLPEMLADAFGVAPTPRSTR